MSVLRYDYLILPAAEFPRENPLPDMGGHRTEGAPVFSPLSHCAEDPERLSPASGGARSHMPYATLDDYNRDKRTRGLRSIVLENDFLRAEFVPRLGGRLWSLFDKTSGKELLHRNPVFQPANLAILNAWFSGGIEYNCGMIGHTVFTASPLHVDVLEDPERGPVLRMYEYERIQGSVYQMDFYLPDTSRFLFLKVRIYNLNDHEIPMYWWSNISVDQRDDVRIIAPTDASISYGDDMKMQLAHYPDDDVCGFDPTYPANHKRSHEYFFYIPDGQRHYEAAVGKDGCGFVQTSTARQKGRKMFLWGTHPGGQRWQEYLAVKGAGYIEIQAGLGRSQAEYVRMPAHGIFEWTEAYGSLSGDPQKLHGSWAEARQEVETQLNACFTEQWLEAEHTATRALSETKGVNVFAGSPWGALERLRRRSGESDLPPHLHFPEGELHGTAAAVKQLLTDGTFPDIEPDSGFIVDSRYLDLMRACAADSGKANPALFETMGIAEYYNNHLEAAAQAWDTALRLYREQGKKPGLLTLYCRACYQAEYGSEEERNNTYALFAEAAALCPDVVPLAIEAGNRAIRERKEREFLTLTQSLSEKVRQNGRIMLLMAECNAACGHFEEAVPLLLDGAAAADIREGETLLSELWIRIHEGILRREKGIPEPEWEPLAEAAKKKGSLALMGFGETEDETDSIRRLAEEQYPLPPQLDFRMKTE